MKRIKLSLSQKLALVMVIMVVMTGLMAILLTNYVVSEQGRTLDQRVEQLRQQTQQFRSGLVVRIGKGEPVVVDPNQHKGPLPADGEHWPGGVPFKIAPVESPDAVIASLKAELQSGKSTDDVLMAVKDRLAYYQSPPVAFQTVAMTLSANDRNGFVGATFSNLVLDPLRAPLFIGVALLAVVAALVSLLLAHTIVRPLKGLQAASARIAAGNYDLEIKTQGDQDMSRLAWSFNRMAEALRHAERLRKEQIANVTHEMRTPLTAIQGYTEALRDGVVSEGRKSETYERMLAEIGFMTKMVTSLREWSNAAARLEKLNLEPMPALLLAREITDRFSGQAARKEITLEIRQDGQPVSPDADLSKAAPIVMVDPDVFRTVLGNLIDNALRHTPEGGRITTSVTTQTTPLTADAHSATGHIRRGSPITKGWAIFRVSDTGEGIPSEHLPYVFERFYRVDKSRARDTGGTGLGLALVRDAVHALGGDINISSSPGEGTTVAFSLPITNGRTTPALDGELTYAKVYSNL